MSPGTYPHSLFVGNGSFEMAHVGAYVMGEDANAQKFKEKHV